MKLWDRNFRGIIMKKKLRKADHAYTGQKYDIPGEEYCSWKGRELRKVREIEVSRLTEVIERLCIEANEHLPEDVKDAIKTCRACEDGKIAKGVLDNIIENYEIADRENVPICQDTGMALSLIHI